MHKLNNKRVIAFYLLHPIFLDTKSRFTPVCIHKKEGHQLLELGGFASTHESCYILSIMENSM